MEEKKKGRGLYNRFSTAPNEAILARARMQEGKKMIVLCPDKDEIREYIKRRLKENGISQDKLGETMGMTPACFKVNLGSSSVSYEKLGYYLWVIDGDDCPFEYSKLNGLNEEG